MAVPLIIDPSNKNTIEKAKWEQFPVPEIGGLKPGNPYVFRPYPKMLVQARQIPPGAQGAGKWATSMAPPSRFMFQRDDDWARACNAAEEFTRSCQFTVNNEEEHKRAREEGWRDDEKEAIEFRAALDKAVSDAAAERNYLDRNMSEKALAESAKAEGEHFGHLGEIPAQPIKRRGRPRKDAA